MAVHYKFKSAKDYDSVPVEGHFISVLQLKERIVERMRLGRAPDFDLLISNAQTNEEYVDEAFLVPKNTSVLVRRVPGTFRMPIVTDSRPVPNVLEEPAKKIDAPVKSTVNASDWTDEFGVDLYEEPESLKAQSALQAPSSVHPAAAAKADEEAKIKAFCDASASDWQRQTQQAYVGGRGLGRGGGQGGRGAGRGAPYMRKTPPEGYVCHRCNEPGHYIQHCPTNKDPSYNIKRVKLPTGIPRTMLVANPDGSYALPNGEIAVLRPNEELFEKEVDALTANNKNASEVPSEFRCPLCKEVLKDAVLTSKCCFKSYCDRCIRNEVISKGRCVCGATNVLADDLLPNKTLRDAIDRLLESNAATSSADNAGSKQNVPDMESALPMVKDKAPSPAVSASAKDAPKSSPAPEEQKVLADGDDAEQKIAEVNVQSEGVEVESAGPKEQVAVQDGNANEEGQQQTFPAGQPARKNKMKRMRPPKQMMPGQMPWRPEGIDEGPMMGYGGNPPFWPPHPMGDGYMPMGDGYMMPYGGPYNGYGVPFDVPFNGAPMMPDPYGYQGMVPPPYPQRDFMGPGYDYNYPGRSNSAVMSREEFEAKKAEARRKQASEHHGRDQNGDIDRDSGSRDNTSKKRPRSSDEHYRSSERRESSRDRRERDRGHESHRSSRNFNEGHSSGDDVSSERRRQRQKVEHPAEAMDSHRSRTTAEAMDSHRSRTTSEAMDSHRSRTSSQAAVVPSHNSSSRSAYEESKRRHEERERERDREKRERSDRDHYHQHSSSSSSKRVSVFLRVKQEESDSSLRKKAVPSSSRSHGRGDNLQHQLRDNHVESTEVDNEPVKSVFNRIAHTKTHQKKP